jgi:hypothetical protein
MCFQRFVLISAAAACGAISPVWAQGPTNPSVTRDYIFPPVGLGIGETASITIVNTATATSSGGTSSPPAPSCIATISFSNATGAIGTPASFTLESEQFKTVTLPFARAGLTGNRGEIQGKVSLTISPSTPTPCGMSFSLETYDSTTGATHALLSSSLASLGPRLPISTPSRQ